jgi:hypothetical protein
LKLIQFKSLKIKKKDMEPQSILGEQVASYLILDATHSHLSMRLAEIKFDGEMTILCVKDQLEKRFGSAVGD